MGFFSIAGLCALVVILIKVIYDVIDNKLKVRELEEIQDGPFPFRVKDTGRIVFDLNKDTTLWCEYTLGIRSDGIYGVDKLELLGINCGYGEIRNLKIGQSVFPIIKAMDEFLVWSKQKTFKTEWKSSFAQAWETMKKNLDNLRVLETEIRKKEKKPK